MLPMSNQVLNQRHFKWILHGAGVCSTLLLILVYMALGNIKRSQEPTGSLIVSGAARGQLLVVDAKRLDDRLKPNKAPQQKYEINALTTVMPVLDQPPTTENTEELNNGHHLMIFSYMRSGSSMNGKVFKDTEKDFYVYEPLIEFAPYQYLTENRICQMREAKCMQYDLKGVYAEDRIDASIRTLKRLYSCNLRNLDDRIMRSIMFENQSGKSWRDFAKCYVDVAKGDVRNLSDYLNKARGTTEFDKHRNVMRYLYPPGPRADKFRNCLDVLEARCHMSDIRVTKVLRLSARLVPRLLNILPNLKVLFVPRDPRGIINSRIETSWFPISINNSKGIIDNIKSLCYKMESDIKMVQILKHDFPGRVKDFRLEDIVKSPMETFGAIFDMMNATMSENHKNNIKKIFSAKPNFQSKWIGSLGNEYIALIQERCSSVFKYYNYFRMTADNGHKSL